MINRPEIKVRAMNPPGEGDRVLQPLREIGSMSKTQFWDLEDIQGALREANNRGIRLESLFAKQRPKGGR